MSGFGSFMDGTTALFLGILLTLCLFLGVGLPSELILTSFETTSVFEVDEDWKSYGKVIFLYSVLYISISTPALLGLMIFVMQIIRKERRDIEQVQQFENEGMY